MPFDITQSYNIVEDASGNKYYQQGGALYNSSSPYAVATQAPPISAGVNYGSPFIYSQVNLGTNFSVSNDVSTVAIHYQVQYDTVINDSSNLWVPTLTAKEPTLAGFEVAVGGAGYTTGDIVEVQGGTANTKTRYVVTAAAGVVQGLSLVGGVAGNYNATKTPTNPAATTAITGAGNNALTVNVEYTGCNFLVPAGFNFAECVASVSWAANATGRRQFSVRKNETVLTMPPTLVIPANSGTELTAQTVASPIIAVTANDRISACVRQDSGGALNITTASSCFQIKLYRSLPSP